MIWFSLFAIFSTLMTLNYFFRKRQMEKFRKSFDQWRNKGASNE